MLLAATNRPEILDPALLRAGRIEEALRYLARPGHTPTVPERRLLALAYHRQGRLAEVNRLLTADLKPALLREALSGVGVSLASPWPGIAWLSNEASPLSRPRRNYVPDRNDWRDLFPLPAPVTPQRPIEVDDDGVRVTTR